MALTEGSKLTLTLARSASIIAALLVGGWFMRGFAEELHNAVTATASNTEAIKLLTTAQTINQMQIDTLVKTQAVTSDQRRVDEDRQRKVEDAILVISTQIQRDQRNR